MGIGGSVACLGGMGSFWNEVAWLWMATESHHYQTGGGQHGQLASARPGIARWEVVD